MIIPIIVSVCAIVCHVYVYNQGLYRLMTNSRAPDGLRIDRFTDVKELDITAMSYVLPPQSRVASAGTSLPGCKIKVPHGQNIRSSPVSARRASAGERAVLPQLVHRRGVPGKCDGCKDGHLAARVSGRLIRYVEAQAAFRQGGLVVADRGSVGSHGAVRLLIRHQCLGPRHLGGRRVYGPCDPPGGVHRTVPVRQLNLAYNTYIHQSKYTSVSLGREKVYKKEKARE